MYKFVYTRCNRETGEVQKLVEARYHNYETCIREEYYYYSHLDHNKYSGHATISYISNISR